MAKKLHYSAHPNAIIEDGAQIGRGSRIWAFVHILPEARIGADCNICDHVFVENNVRISDRVTVKSGVQLWDGVRLESDVFVGPNATFTNDKFPRSKQYLEKVTETFVKHGASIGANATILPGLTIGAYAFIEAGSVVTRDVPPRAIVVGNPARIVSYVDTEEKNAISPKDSGQLVQSSVSGVRMYQLNNVKDLRGDLSAIEWEKDLPFSPRRIFFVYNVPNSRVRGEHAHKECQQFLLCLSGSVSVVVEDGRNREEYLLENSTVGIHIPPGIWSIQYKYSPGAIVCVLASHDYDPNDYIRDYDEFISYISQKE